MLAARRVYRLTEHTIDKRASRCSGPCTRWRRWSTTLSDPFTPWQITVLYGDHGTHEQFHAEFEMDMGLVLLPSEKLLTAV